MLKLLSYFGLLGIVQVALSAPLADEQSEIKRNFSSYMLRKVLTDIDATQNLLIAPLEMQKLYENHLSEVAYDAGATASPIKVSNRLTPNDTLISVVGLHTRWVHNFQKRDTHKHIFHLTTQRYIYTNAMAKNDYFPYAALPSLNATALKLSLEGHHIRMLVLLPDTLDGLQPLAQALGAQLPLLEALMSDAADGVMQPTLVRIIMPKFKLTYRAKLNELVSVTSAKDIYQETQIIVDELGIGDFERTTVLFWNAHSSLRVAPKLFDMNRPFLFLIYDSEGLQFIGQLAHF